MRFLTFAACVLLATPLCAATEEEQAVALIEKLGGTATIEGQAGEQARVYAVFDAMTDVQLSRLKGMKSLAGLEVIEAVRITDRGLETLKTLPNLRKLTLYHATISDRGLIALKGLTNLKALNLSETRVGDQGLAHLAGLTGLETLDLYQTLVTDRGTPSLKTLANLKYLGVAATRVGDKGLAFVAECKNLQHLDVTRTGVTEEMIRKWEAANPKLKVAR